MGLVTALLAPVPVRAAIAEATCDDIERYVRAQLDVSRAHEIAPLLEEHEQALEVAVREHPRSVIRKKDLGHRRTV